MVTIFQATVTIVFTVVASQLGIIIFMINRTDALTRDLRTEIRDLAKELRVEMRELATQIDSHTLAHAKGDIGT